MRLIRVFAFEGDAAFQHSGLRGLNLRLRAVARDFDGYRVIRRYRPRALVIGQSPADLSVLGGQSVCMHRADFLVVLGNGSCSGQRNGAGVGSIGQLRRLADNAVREAGHCIFLRLVSAVLRRALDLDLQASDQVAAFVGLGGRIDRRSRHICAASVALAVAVVVIVIIFFVLLVAARGALFAMRAVAIVDPLIVVVTTRCPDRIDGLRGILPGQHNRVAGLIPRCRSSRLVSPAKELVVLALRITILTG